MRSYLGHPAGPVDPACLQLQVGRRCIIMYLVVKGCGSCARPPAAGAAAVLTIVATGVASNKQMKAPTLMTVG